MPWPLRMLSYAGIIVLILLIYFGYRYFNYVRLLNLKPVWVYKLLFFLLAGMFLIYPVAGHIEFWSQGNFSRTGYPDPVVYLFWYGVICMGVMVNWLLLNDLLRPVIVRFTDMDPVKIKGLFGKAFLIIAGLTVVYTGAKMAWDTSRVTVDNIVYTMPGGDSSFEPLTVVHIADLHVDKYTGQKMTGKYIQKVNDANPDIVIIAGDLISSGTDYIEEGADALAAIRSTYGTWFVMGDHDHWSDTTLIAETLRARGINVLQDENTTVRHNDMIIKITGITEVYSQKVEPDLLAGLLNEDMGESLRLLASHQGSEQVLNAAIESDVHQLLTGHTHGGQIRVRLFFYPLTAARAETPYVKGHWMFGSLLFNVNSGLGFTLTPVRYNAPAQVSVITVKHGS